MKRLYVANLPYDLCTDQDLRLLFSDYPIKSTRVVKDDAGRPRGFCFVEMMTEDAAQDAISRFDDRPYGGRRLTVRLAHEKQPAGKQPKPPRRAHNRDWDND